MRKIYADTPALFAQRMSAHRMAALSLIQAQESTKSRPSKRPAYSGAHVPEEHILIGAASPGEFDEWNHHFILALLPAGERRSDESGVYPCWYGGYKDMESDFKGMFCLGVSSRGKRMLGEVLDRGDGVEITLGVFDGIEYSRTFFYGERDMRGEDLTTYVGMDDADGAFFPLFLRYDADNVPSKWVDVSNEHSVYMRRYIS